MENVRKLMKPGASLLLMETVQDQVDAQFVYGLLPGWWLGEDPERKASILESCPCSIVIMFCHFNISGAAYAHWCKIDADLVKNVAVNVMVFDEMQKMGSRSDKCTLCGSGGSAGKWGGGVSDDHQRLPFDSTWFSSPIFIFLYLRVHPAQFESP